MEATETDYCLLQISPEDVKEEAFGRGIKLTDEQSQAFLLEHFDGIKERLHKNEALWEVFWQAVRGEIEEVYSVPDEQLL